MESFSSTFLGYDLQAGGWVRCTYAHPFLEALAGIPVVAGTLNGLSISEVLFIGAV